MKGFLKKVGYWFIHFIGFVSIILAIGSMLGAFFYVIFGSSFTEYPILLLIKKGLWAGFRYAGVWAVGLSIVLCFLKGARKGKVSYGK